jgi:hypothetical protein
MEDEKALTEKGSQVILTSFRFSGASGIAPGSSFRWKPFGGLRAMNFVEWPESSLF